MTSEEPYLTPVREAGSRTVTLNVNLTPGSGPLSEAQRDELLAQITNTLEQMDTPPVVRQRNPVAFTDQRGPTGNFDKLD